MWLCEDTKTLSRKQHFPGKEAHLARGKHFVKWDYYTCKPALLPAARRTIMQPVFVLYMLKYIIRKRNKHAEHGYGATFGKEEEKKR